MFALGSRVYSSMLLSAVKNIRGSLRLPVTPFPMRFHFSNEKESPSEAGNNQPSEKAAQPEKELKNMKFEELVEVNTDQSLRLMRQRIEAAEKSIQANEKEIKELKSKIEIFSEHETDIHDKIAKLKENIEMEDEEIKRVTSRSDKELADSRAFAISKIAKELLEVADSILRCNKLAKELYPEQEDEYVQETNRCESMIQEIFKKYQIQEFDPINEQYDPNTQQALGMIPCPPNAKPNSVAYTIRTGYMIKDRLLRSARVGVFTD